MTAKEYSMICNLCKGIGNLFCRQLDSAHIEGEPMTKTQNQSPASPNAASPSPPPPAAAKPSGSMVYTVQKGANTFPLPSTSVKK